MASVPRSAEENAAARGDAFLALAVSDAPVQKFVFRWLGKTHEALAAPVSAEASPGQSAEKMPRRWQAVMLLPVPLEEKESALELTVSRDHDDDEPPLSVLRWGSQGELLYRSPLAPVLRLMAMRAIARKAAGLTSSSQSSMENSF